MLVTYERFNDVALPLYDPVESQGVWPARSQYVDLSSGGAYRLNGLQRSKKASRTLRRTATLLTPVVTTDQAALAALQAALGLLEAEAGKVGKLWGRTAAGALVWTDAELLDVRAVAEPRTVFRFRAYVALDVETEFELPTPVWYADLQTVLVFSDLYDVAGDGLLLMGVEGITPGTAAATTWLNAGNYPLRDLLITLTSGTGITSGLTMNNLTTGHQLVWPSAPGPTLTAGQSLAINTGNSSVYRNGIAAYSELTTPSNHADWMELAPGVNQVSITITDTATDDATKLTVAYYSTSA